MFRRISHLSPLIRSSERSFLPHRHQASNGWSNSEAFCTEIETPGKFGGFLKDKSPFITFVLGGPGSGKGTQCLKIADVFGFSHISAGDLLRKEIASRREEGQKILEIIKEGKIVPSEVTVKLIQDAIRSTNSSKFLIDGFPRTEENRVAYESIIGTEPNVVLFFDCPKEEMIKRVLCRNQGRIDDNNETIKMRLKIFEELTMPVINHYSKRGILHRISATGSEEEIFEKVRPIFDKYKVIPALAVSLGPFLFKDETTASISIFLLTVVKAILR